MAIQRELAVMVALIKNPGAGSVEDHTDADLRQALFTGGIDFDLFEDKNPATAADAALAKGHDHLFACGGDGTIAGVVSSIMRSGRNGIKLAIVPLGTGNLIAAALGIPGQIEDAVKAAAGNSTKKVDVGRIENDYFLLGLGIGATETFVNETSGAFKEKFGRLAYIGSLIKSTGEPLFELNIEADGKRAHSRAEAVTLSNYWGTPKVKLVEGTRDDDGVMECLINHRLTIGKLLRLSLRGLMGDVSHDSEVDLITGSKFVIRTTPTLPVQLDGNETKISTPIEVHVLRQALEVCVPQVEGSPE